MTEGFTGLNIDRAIQDLENFRTTCGDAGYDIYWSFTPFFRALREKWASPIAKEYTSKAIPEYINLINEYTTTYRHILSGAAYAATYLASAHGVSYGKAFDQFERGMTESDYAPDDELPCEDNLDGLVGMATEVVKSILETFKNRMKAALNKFDNIPDGIAFYDPNGELLQIYNKNVNEFKIKFEEMFNKIVTAMTGYIETETENILLAKERSQEEMSAKA